MKNLNKEQIKNIAQFLNGTAIALFTTGVIVPYFSNPEDLFKTSAFGAYAILVSGALLVFSTWTLRGVK